MESARFAVPAEGLLCHPCRAVPPMFERAVAYAVYEDGLREMIHLLKYERMQRHRERCWAECSLRRS